MTDLTIRAPSAEDRAAWDALYAAYATFYQSPQTPQMRDRVWGWLHDPAQQTSGLVAQAADDTLLGIAHYRPFARPLAASTGVYLDDLFVSPDARGMGVADALIQGLRDVAKSEGWTVVRWITAEDNYRGRGMYDRVASRTGWVTYDMDV